MPIIADYHMHSDHSADSEAPMEEMVQSSIDKDLKEICFTEHHDLDYPEYPDVTRDTFTLDIPSYKKELFSLREKYKDRIVIRFGIEVGMQAHLSKRNLADVQSEAFDFVIASQHLVGRRDPFYPGFWEPDTVENIFLQFFDETYGNMTDFHDFDVLGHLDYIARYVPEGDTTYSYERFSEKIDRILLWLIENGKGLDVNSKVLSLDEKLPPNPHPDVLRRFKELGGSIITFGSDAHSPAKVAGHFEKLAQIARDCGFSEYYTFEARKPIPHRL